MIEDIENEQNTSVDTMLVAYIIIGLIFGCTIILFISFMIKLKIQEGATTGDINSNKVQHNSSYNRFENDGYPGMEK